MFDGYSPSPQRSPPAARDAGGALQTVPAPIALFVFNRPDHTRRCLESLAHCPEFLQSPLHIFCDGPRSNADTAATQAVRDIVNQWPHPAKTLHLAPANQGLANSVIQGIQRVLEDAESIVVVEDDLVVAPGFLRYLNHALQYYAGEERVMQIAAHMYPTDLPVEGDAVFLPLASSWGWATWRRAWQHFDPTMADADRVLNDRALRHAFNMNGSHPSATYLERQRKGQADSWYIRWYLSIFMRGGLVLYPRHSLVRNGGFDGTGVHCGAGGSPYDVDDGFHPSGTGHAPASKLPAPGIDPAVQDIVGRFLARQNRLSQRLLRRLRTWFA
jgi:GT2 family glycosyltransferase